MPKVKLENVLDKDELKDLDEKRDLCAFEKYCGSCDLYNTSECSFYYEDVYIDRKTEWKNLGCKKFVD